jgi:phosphatidylinositol-3-phosphatase
MPVRVLRLLPLVALVTVAPACSSARTPGATYAAKAAALSSRSPCGHSGRPPARYKHVIWIVMENKAAGEALDSRSAPFTARLARQCGQATRYYAVAHPSLPNYIALTSGSTHGITDDAGPDVHPLAGPSIFSQTRGKWRALEESMPGRCSRLTTSRYAVRHDPAVYYTGIASQCPRRVIPLSLPLDLSARFTFITPNIVNDTHNAPVSVGDAWLASTLKAIFRSSQYRAGRTAVFVTWDEDDRSAGNRVALIAIAPTIPSGTRDRARLSHYSLLRTTEQLLGLRPLGNAIRAHGMRRAFHL